MEITKGFEDYSSNGTVSGDLVNPPQQLPPEDVWSPLNAQFLELFGPELYPESLGSPQVTSSPNCYFEENSTHKGHNTNLSFAHQDIKEGEKNNQNKTNTTTKTTKISGATAAITNPKTTATTTNNSNLSLIFDSPEKIENDISTSIDFSPRNQFCVTPVLTNPQVDQFNLSSTQSKYPQESVVPLMGLPPPLPSVLEEECLYFMPPYMGNLNSSSLPCSSMETTVEPFLPGNLSANNTVAADNSGIFNESMHVVGNELQTQEIEYQGDNIDGGFFCPEPLSRLYNSTQEQKKATSDESQHVGNGGGSSIPVASDIPSMEDPAFKVGRLSVEERKEKIHRYMKKRNERNFSKKIKYACRKTLADSRPRVRGRFAKNDEFSETQRACSNHEEDEDEESPGVVKEQDMVDSFDIFTHISGVNSFKCNYPIQSWI